MNQITKQQVVSKVHEANTILIVASHNAGIGQLAAGIGLSSILSDVGKNAVFLHDRDIPMAMDFLTPDKFVTQNIDTLRDFIIRLDKNKVRKFSYSRADDKYDICITPDNNAIITEQDVEYRKGDFNVDLVIALDAASRDSLSRKVSQHEQLMENLTMINIVTGDKSSSLEADTWQADESGSLGEMIYELGQSLNISDYKQVTLDALMTSIVGYTNHFRNKHTQARTMHVAGELIERGADLSMVAEHLGDRIKEKAASEVPDIVNDTLKEEPVAQKEKAETIARKVKPKSMEQDRSGYISHADASKELIIGARAKKASRPNVSAKKEEIQVASVKLDASGNLNVLRNTPPVDSDDDVSDKVAASVSSDTDNNQSKKQGEGSIPVITPNTQPSQTASVSPLESAPVSSPPISPIQSNLPAGGGVTPNSMGSQSSPLKSSAMSINGGNSATAPTPAPGGLGSTQSGLSGASAPNSANSGLTSHVAPADLSKSADTMSNLGLPSASSSSVNIGVSSKDKSTSSQADTSDTVLSSGFDSYINQLSATGSNQKASIPTPPASVIPTPSSVQAQTSSPAPMDNYSPTPASQTSMPPSQHPSPLTSPELTSTPVNLPNLDNSVAGQSTTNASPPESIIPPHLVAANPATTTDNPATPLPVNINNQQIAPANQAGQAAVGQDDYYIPPTAPPLASMA